MKVAGIMLAVVVLVGASFWGGMAYTGAASDAAATAGGAFPRTADGAGRGGPMSNLTDEERARVEGMTEEERQAFFQEQFGDQPPEAGGVRGLRGGSVEGEVIEVGPDTITIKLPDAGSQTIYTDENTAIGYVDGASELAAGSSIIAITVPEADGVTTARAIVVE